MLANLTHGEWVRSNANRELGQDRRSTAREGQYGAREKRAYNTMAQNAETDSLVHVGWP